jgi:lambda family phage portal protein
VSAIQNLRAGRDLMNFMDRIIATVAPGRALERARARVSLNALTMHFDAATTGRRSKSWFPDASDADAAGGRRSRLAFIARDMVRNTPFAARAQQVIANNTVGDGIIPKIVGLSDGMTRQAMELVESHLDTTAIDADGRANLYGIQRLAINAIVDAGEVLIRRRVRERGDGLPLPFQIQILEADYIDTSWDGIAASGNLIKEGIEYDLIGRRVAYYLFENHPGSSSYRNFAPRLGSRRVPASEILHIYRQDRPGQMRGTSWFAPVALNLQDLGDHQDAHLIRQKIAACFAAFRTTPDGIGSLDTEENSIATSLQPGAIVELGQGEDIRFATPPGVDGFDEFSRVVLRSVAAGMGITYEALVGDLSGVNFSSGRMGRMEMDRNVSSWQWLMMIPQFMDPFANWFKEAWALQTGNEMVLQSKITWVPPHRILVDPNKEIAAMKDKIRAGLASRQGIIRELGFDPEKLLAEQIQDAASADAAGLNFESDPRHDAAKMKAEAPANE